MALTQVQGGMILPSTTLTTPIIATTMGVGGATPAASGSGITFPATQSASTDANTLDDYEEGSWTPTLTGGSGNPTYTLGTTVAKYVKIGKTINFTMSLQWSSLSGGSGALYISLPFTTDSTSQYFQGNFCIGYSGGMVGTPKGGYSDPGTSSFFAIKDTTGGTNLTVADLASSGHLICGGTFMVA